MHYLHKVIKEIDRSHPHLGQPVAVAMLTIKAKKLLLLVSPRGCGKSRITSYAGLSYPNSMLQDRLSIAGLMTIKEMLNGFQSVVVVDDIAKTQTPYARISTLTTLAELVYSHYCHSHLSGTSYEIDDFYGAALVNIQPVLLREVVKSPEWEASMMDKSLRYYHLFRPLAPNPLPPTLKLDFGYSFDMVETPKLTGELADKLQVIGEIQWGLARLKEHTIDLLKAAACLDKRKRVNQSDFQLLERILQPMVVESLVMTKKEFETDRNLNDNELAILTEFVTYGHFTLRDLSRDYHLSERQCYRIMAKYERDWIIINKEPTTYAPSPELAIKLKEVGLI